MGDESQSHYWNIIAWDPVQAKPRDAHVFRPLERESRSCGDESVKAFGDQNGCSHQAIPAVHCCFSSTGNLVMAGRDCRERCALRRELQRKSAWTPRTPNAGVFNARGQWPIRQEEKAGPMLTWWFGTWVLRAVSLFVFGSPPSAKRSIN